MDNKRTPNHLKVGGPPPKSAGSTSKFSKPRAQRKPDANSTILLGSNYHNISIMGSSRNMNQTVRHNNDVTISGHSNPRIKSSITAPAHDVELEYDLAYNEYLEALMKQQIVKKMIVQHEEKLSDQILIQSEHLRKLENNNKDICNEIDKLKVQSEKVEVLDMLKHHIEEIENLCGKYNIYNRLHQLNGILTEESNLISVRNIKPINSQEEYNELIVTLNDLVVIMEKIQNSGRNFEEVNNLAVAIKNFKELRDTVEQTTRKVCELKKKAASTFINQASDLFAEQGGYS